MVKKKTEDLDAEDFEEDYEESEAVEDDDEEEDEEPVKKKKKVKNKDWVIQHSPETWTVINPKTKEIIAQSQDLEILRLQLQVITAQKSSEASKQTE